MADNKGEIDSLQVDAEEVVSGDTESVQSAEVSRNEETESATSEGGEDERSPMVTFSASQIYPGEEEVADVSFTLKEARSVFPILDDIFHFPIIQEKSIVLPWKCQLRS